MIEKQVVLIVDDEPTNIRILGQAISKQCIVKTAKNGAKAIDIALSDGQPDLILLDIQLPDINGYEVCKILKQNPKTKTIPIIFITGLDSVEDEEKGLILGAMDYIRKPFNLPTVLARVDIQLRLKKKTDMLEQLAHIDGLTDVSNRRSFDEKIELEWRRASRNRESISIVMIDIDHFKDFNDHYGHTAGDHALKAVAQALQSVLSRAGDFFARYGGEEFVAIVTSSNKEGIEKIINEFMERIEQLKIKHEFSSVGPHLTISVGVATAIASESRDYPTLIEKADEMLYQSKNNGRNRATYAQ